MPTLDTTPPAAPFVLTNGSFKTAIAPEVTLQTSLGNVVLQLDPYNAPMSTANMLAYVNDGFYDGTLFHRVVGGTSFQLAQGGGFTSGLVYKTPTYSPIALESNNGLSNIAGTVGMARTLSANSATSQFYINAIDNTGFDYVSAAYPGYAVFGSVVSGMSVVQNMVAQPTTTVAGSADVPQTDILINSAKESTAGISKSKTGVVLVGALESGAKWEYSTDSGSSWKKGKGTSFTLPVGTYAEHTVQVRQTDSAGNVSTYTGESSVTLVVEKTAPKMTSMNPAKGSNTLGITESISFNFDEAVTIGSGAITLKTASGVVIQTYTTTPGPSSGTVWTFNPADDLQYGTGYQLEITKGTFVDVAGNAYAGLKSYKFFTTDTISTTSDSYTMVAGEIKVKYTGTANFTGTGNDGNNVITGGSGSDILRGGLGNDSLVGGAGTDLLYGHAGSDTLVGGSGSDYFVFLQPTDTGIDLIDDFTAGEDQIAFIKAGFSGLSSPIKETDLLVGSGKTKPDNGQHLIYDSKSGALYYDEDGLAATAATKIAIVGKSTHPALTVADFYVE